MLDAHALKLHAINHLNIKRYAELHHLPYQRLRRAYQGGKTRSNRQSTADYRRLSPDLDLALCRYLDALDAIGYGIHRGLIHAQATALLDETYTGLDEAPPPLGKNWSRRWLARHPQYRRVKTTLMEVLRKLQQQPEGIREWYGKLKAIIDELGVVPEDMYNMDETGCRIGVAKNQYVYTARGRDNIVMPSSNNRELMTLVETVSAVGRVINPMIIVRSSTILEHWVEQLPDGYAVSCSESGYSNDEIALHWLHHFDKMTKDVTVGVWRLLVLDGYSSHMTREFYEYAAAHKI